MLAHEEKSKRHQWAMAFLYQRAVSRKTMWTTVFPKGGPESIRVTDSAMLTEMADL